MDAVVSIPGAEPWSAFGRGARGRVGIIVTHGFTGNPRSTRPLGQRLATEGYTVEVPLLPGHGTDVRDLSRTRYRDWFAHLGRVTEHLAEHCDDIVLVGLSLGGTLSLDLASQRGDLISAVVSVNAPLTAPTGPIARAGPLLSLAVPYVPRRLAGLPPDDVARPEVDEGAYGKVSTRAARSIVRELPRVRTGLYDLDQPVLVVRSTVDHTVPPGDADELMELLGSSDIRELVCERSYHVVLLDHDAPLVEEAVLAFVGDVTGR